MMVDATDNAADARLVATFLLGDAAFGVGAEHVQEVVRPGSITPVHHAPSAVVGIRNLRGRIVTVIDLAERLELESAGIGADSRVLIVDWHGEPVGLMVDQMGDTIPVDDQAIMAPPANVHGVQARNLKGVYRGGGDRLVALLDLETVLQPEATRASPEGQGPRAS